MLWVANGYDSRIIGDSQPFVAINGPRVGVLHSSEQRGVQRRDCGPHPEGSVHMDPRALLSRFCTNLFGRIESAGVYVSGLDAEDRAIVERGQRIHAHAAMGIGRHGLNPRTSKS